MYSFSSSIFFKKFEQSLTTSDCSYLFTNTFFCIFLYMYLGLHSQMHIVFEQIVIDISIFYRLI